MKIEKNFIGEEEQRKICDLLFSNKIPWRYQKDSAYGNNRDKYQSTYGYKNEVPVPSFGSIVLQEKLLNTTDSMENFVRILMPLISMNKKKFGLDPKNLFRVRLGLHLPTINKPLHNNPHIDTQEPHTVVLYYVNTVDGDTFFFDKDFNITGRESPEMGKAIMFDGLTLHSSSIPTQGSRITVNFNYD